MVDRPLYHVGMRNLQDRFDSRRIADRLSQITVHRQFTEQDRAFIEQASFFFLATADADGWPDCSYKGGMPGFVKVIDANTLAFPDYDGNGMFRSLGNIQANGRVGLLFIDFQQSRRMRVNGRADLIADEILMAQMPGAQNIVRVQAEQIFPNCPRYLPESDSSPSRYAPRPEYQPPEPAWKSMDLFKDALPKKTD